MNRKKLVCLCTAFVLLASLAGCAEQADGASVSEPKDNAVAVEVAEAAVGSIRTTKEITGKVTADSEVAVVSPLPGEVVSVRVSVGDRVKKSDILFTMDKEDVEKQYRPLKDSYDRTVALRDATMAQLRQNLDNTRKLYEIGAASRLEVEQAELAVLQQQTNFDTQIDQLQTNLDNITDTLQDASVTAPISGTVTSLSVSEGGMTSSASPALILSKLDVVTIQFSVSETVLSSIYAGQPVIIDVPAAAGARYETVISSVSPSVDPYTQLYTVKASLDNEDGLLTSGMFVGATLDTGLHEDVVLAPTKAISTVSGRQVIYIVVDGAARRVEVETGMVSGDDTEVISGLSGGEQVIVKGQSYVDDGQAVRIVEGDAQ